jgi:hypothetical protein
VRARDDVTSIFVNSNANSLKFEPAASARHALVESIDDISTPSNIRKTLNEKRESGDTFFAVLAQRVSLSSTLENLEKTVRPSAPKVSFAHSIDSLY